MYTHQTLETQVPHILTMLDVLRWYGTLRDILNVNKKHHVQNIITVYNIQIVQYLAIK